MFPFARRQKHWLQWTRVAAKFLQSRTNSKGYLSRRSNSWVRKYQEPQPQAQPRDADQVQAARTRVKAHLADWFEELTRRCLNEVTDARLQSATSET